MKVKFTLYALRSTLLMSAKSCLLLFCLGFMSHSAFGQAGTTITYEDQFGSLTLNHNGLRNGKHSYLGADGTEAYWTGTRWDIKYPPNDILYFSNTKTSMNPPHFSIGNWQIGPNSGMALIRFQGTGTTTTVLPIEFTQFYVQNTEGSKNNLTWTTASEKDNSHFDIERSTDGITFHSIGRVRGNNKPSTYQFVDNQPFATSYYRLRQIDFDGTETVSKVISVVLKGKGKGLTIYPTLVSNVLTVEYTEGALYQVFNLLGQQVLSGKTPFGGRVLDVSALAKGTYILKVGTEQAKFIKQ